jgi:serine/threonine protein kinase
MLLDFGLAVDLRAELPNTRAGTLQYMSPEALMCESKRISADFEKSHLVPLQSGDRHHRDGDGNGDGDYDDSACHGYDARVDTWAVGVLAFELLAGYTPFAAYTEQQVADRIASGTLHFPRHFSALARSFVEQCLTWHCAERCTVAEMMQHPWIRAQSDPPSLKI